MVQAFDADGNEPWLGMYGPDIFGVRRKVEGGKQGLKI
jgi:hypothetical protein